VKRGLYNRIGFKPKKPYIMSPTHPDRKIYGVFDITHAQKNFCNALCDKVGYLPEENAWFSKRDFEDLLHETSGEISTGYRLTQYHLDCKGSARQDVSRAITVISHTVC
jgi:hypothetical protein